MKEKRYFCDYWNELNSNSFRVWLIIIVSIVIIVSISGIISYNLIMSEHGHELNSFSEDNNKYLDEIANNVIQEGIGIDLSSIPEDIREYEITKENDGIIFKYYLDNDKDMTYAVSANMTVELSDDFNIISKKTNYSSKEDYQNDVKIVMIFTSIMIGVLIWLVTIVLVVFTCEIIAHVSKAKKNRSLS